MTGAYRGLQGVIVAHKGCVQGMTGHCRVYIECVQGLPKGQQGMSGKTQGVTETDRGFTYGHGFLNPVVFC